MFETYLSYSLVLYLENLHTESSASLTAGNISRNPTSRCCPALPAIQLEVPRFPWIFFRLTTVKFFISCYYLKRAVCAILGLIVQISAHGSQFCFLLLFSMDSTNSEVMCITFISLDKMCQYILYDVPRMLQTLLNIFHLSPWTTGCTFPHFTSQTWQCSKSSTKVCPLWKINTTERFVLSPQHYLWRLFKGFHQSKYLVYQC